MAMISPPQLVSEFSRPLHQYSMFPWLHSTAVDGAEGQAIKGSIVIYIYVKNTKYGFFLL